MPNRSVSIKGAELASGLGINAIGGRAGTARAGGDARCALPVLAAGVLAHQPGMASKYRLEDGHGTPLWWVWILLLSSWTRLAARAARITWPSST